MGKLAELGATGVLAFGVGCAGESLSHPPLSEALYMPDTPVWSTEALPDVPADRFAELEAATLAPPPRPIRRSISLGFIGDEPLGRFDVKPVAVEAPVLGHPVPPCRCPTRSRGGFSW
jgi:hypothetical protein